jgi:hypothetical protein
MHPASRPASTPPLSCQTTTTEAMISISESAPKPANATEPATTSARTNTTVPTTFHASVTYSSARPRRSSIRSFQPSRSPRNRSLQRTNRHAAADPCLPSSQPRAASVAADGLLEQDARPLSRSSSDWVGMLIITQIQAAVDPLHRPVHQHGQHLARERLHQTPSPPPSTGASASTAITAMMPPRVDSPQRKEEFADQRSTLPRS